MKNLELVSIGFGNIVSAARIVALPDGVSVVPVRTA